eukprot:scaffold4768_cov412-Prasinococcus_capsulatus_cf.AAC.6
MREQKVRRSVVFQAGKSQMLTEGAQGCQWSTLLVGRAYCRALVRAFFLLCFWLGFGLFSGNRSKHGLPLSPAPFCLLYGRHSVGLLAIFRGSVNKAPVQVVVQR